APVPARNRDRDGIVGVQRLAGGGAGGAQVGGPARDQPDDERQAHDRRRDSGDAEPGRDGGVVTEQRPLGQSVRQGGRQGGAVVDGDEDGGADGGQGGHRRGHGQGAGRPRRMQRQCHPAQQQAQRQRE